MATAVDSNTQSSNPPPPPPPPAPASTSAPATTLDKSGSPPGSAEKRAQSAPVHSTVHVVQRGDTLPDIAGHHGTSVGAIRRVNPQIRDSKRVNPGDHVNLPRSSDFFAAARRAFAPRTPESPATPTKATLPATPPAAQAAPSAAKPQPISPAAKPPVTRSSSAAPMPKLVKSPEAMRVDDAAEKTVHADKQVADTKAAAQWFKSLNAQLPVVEKAADDARGNLKSAVAAEIDKRVAPAATDATVARAGLDISARYAADPGKAASVKGAVSDIRSDREVNGVATGIRAQKTLFDELRVFNEGYVKASPAAKTKLMKDPVARHTLDTAAAYASQQLTGKTPSVAVGMPAKSTDLAGIPAQRRTEAAIAQLDQLTRGLDKDVAAAVVDRALPTFEKFGKDHAADFADSTPFAAKGTRSLMNIAAHVADTPLGDAAIARFSKLHDWNASETRGAVRDAIAGGADPAYAIAVGRQMTVEGRDPSRVTDTISDGLEQGYQSKIANGDTQKPVTDIAERMTAHGLDSTRVWKIANDGVQQFRQNAAAHAAKLAEHTAQLTRLIHADGRGMTPKQLQKAVSEYIARKGAAWQAEQAALTQQVASDGAKLIRQLSDLKAAHLPPGYSAIKAKIDGTIKSAIDDPRTNLSMAAAIRADPGMGDIDKATAMKNLFTGAKLGDGGRKLVNEVASGYLRATMRTTMQGVDLRSPASVAAAKGKISGLASAKYAGLLGVQEKDLKKALDAVQDTVDRVAKAPATAAEELAKLDKKLANDAGLSKTFNKDTVAGVAMRGVALTFAAVGLYNSLGAANADSATAKDKLKGVLDSAGFGQKLSEIALGVEAVDDKSLIGGFGGGWKPFEKMSGGVVKAGAGEFIAGLSVALDTVSAIGSATGIGTKQDLHGAAFSAAGAAGGALTIAPAFGGAAILGPIGVGITAAGVIGKLQYDAVKDAHKDESESRMFLQSGGYSEAAARALAKRVGTWTGAAGAAQMSFLMQYAQFRHMTPEQVQNWVNARTDDELESLSKHLMDSAAASRGKSERFGLGPQKYEDQWVQSPDGTSGMTEVPVGRTFRAFEWQLKHDDVPLP